MLYRPELYGSLALQLLGMYNSWLCDVRLLGCVMVFQEAYGIYCAYLKACQDVRKIF